MVGVMTDIHLSFRATNATKPGFDGSVTLPGCVVQPEMQRCWGMEMNQWGAAENGVEQRERM
jgi:hypothetical protein